MTKQQLSFLIKPASYDCNLVCDYCFYKRTEETYPGDVKHRMDEATFTTLVEKAQTDETQAVSYIWQGGEPMLMGLDFYKRAVEIQNSRKSPHQMIANTIQTNGIMIDKEWAQFFAEQQMLVGISIDGPRNLHDIHRFNNAKESVFDKVIEACDIMTEYGVDFNILSVVTMETIDHAAEIFRFFRDKDYHYLQFIDCIESAEKEPAPFSLKPEAFGKFLCDMFDIWFEEGYPYYSIRLFDNYLQYRVGREPECCMYKNDCGSYFVVEHNGDIFTCDFFVRDEWLLGNINENSIDELIDHPLREKFATLRHIEHKKCEACEWLGFCQRGCIKSRAFPDRGYEALNFLCESYRMFFAYADERYDFLAWDIMRRHSGAPVPVAGRNDPCVCGSGKKYKKCCEKYSHIMKK